MTTQQIADRLVELCRIGQSDTAYRELFAQDASSHEMPGVPGGSAHGLEAILAKAEAWDKDVEEIMRFEATDPLVYGHLFSVGMGIQLKKKDGTTTPFEQEICVYETRDGKIVSERFIYSMPG